MLIAYFLVVKHAKTDKDEISPQARSLAPFSTASAPLLLTSHKLLFRRQILFLAEHRGGALSFKKHIQITQVETV